MAPDCPIRDCLNYATVLCTRRNDRWLGNIRAFPQFVAYIDRFVKVNSSGLLLVYLGYVDCESENTYTSRRLPLNTCYERVVCASSTLRHEVCTKAVLSILTDLPSKHRLFKSIRPSLFRSTCGLIHKSWFRSIILHTQ